MFIFCNQLQIEDERHFLIQCSFYNDIRADVFNDQFSNRQFNVLNDVDKLIYLVRKVPRKLAKYIVKAYMRRRNALYNWYHSNPYNIIQMFNMYYLSIDYIWNANIISREIYITSIV